MVYISRFYLTLWLTCQMATKLKVSLNDCNLFSRYAVSISMHYVPKLFKKFERRVFLAWHFEMFLEYKFFSFAYSFLSYLLTFHILFPSLVTFILLYLCYFFLTAIKYFSGHYRQEQSHSKHISLNHLYVNSHFKNLLLLGYSMSVLQLVIMSVDGIVWLMH